MIRAWLLCAVAWLSAPWAWSQALPAKLALCAACHGADGNAAIAGMPSLAGQPRVFLENQLVMIREGMRDIPAMKGMLDGLTDQDLAWLARHYAGQPVKPRPGPRQEPLFERGRKLSVDMRCSICHLPDFRGREQMPRLAGQREDYLLHSMRQFLSNQAIGRDTLMTAALHGASDDDLRAMAHYLARVEP